MVTFLLVLPLLDPKCPHLLSPFPTFAMQSFILSRADRILGVIGVWSSIYRGQDARTCVPQDEDLILKFVPVGGLATSGTVECDVTTLAHESGNNSVRGGTLQCSEHQRFLLSLELV